MITDWIKLFFSVLDFLVNSLDLQPSLYQKIAYWEMNYLEVMKLVLMTEWKRMYFSFSHFIFCVKLQFNSFFCSLSFLRYFSESWDFNLLDILYAFICVILSCYSKRKISTKWGKFSNTVHFRFSEEVPFFVKINHFHADSGSFWKKIALLDLLNDSSL